MNRLTLSALRTIIKLRLHSFQYCAIHFQKFPEEIHWQPGTPRHQVLPKNVQNASERSYCFRGWWQKLWTQFGFLDQHGMCCVVHPGHKCFREGPKAVQHWQPRYCIFLMNKHISWWPFRSNSFNESVDIFGLIVWFLVGASWSETRLL